jgi:hypothetical protein
MAYTKRSRDRYKNFVALLGGLAAFGTVAGTGAAAGLAAHDSEVRDQEQQRERAEAAAARAAVAMLSQPVRQITVIRTRPSRTVVHTRVVHAASAPGSATPATGGTVAGAPYPSTTGSSSGSSQAVSAAPPPAPAPAPAPAPSSGSTKP